jgi:hypothetical protein
MINVFLVLKMAKLWTQINVIPSLSSRYSKDGMKILIDFPFETNKLGFDFSYFSCSLLFPTSFVNNSQLFDSVCLFTTSRNLVISLSITSLASKSSIFFLSSPDFEMTLKGVFPSTFFTPSSEDLERPVASISVPSAFLTCSSKSSTSASFSFGRNLKYFWNVSPQTNFSVEMDGTEFVILSENLIVQSFTISLFVEDIFGEISETQKVKMFSLFQKVFL